MLPNFLVLGAQKTGTTSLYSYLQQHPDIYMCPEREPKFFAIEGTEVSYRGPAGRTDLHAHNPYTTLDRYEQLFEGADGETAVGEISPWYLYSAQAPERIHHHIPEAKLIAILRNPVERAYSAYLMARRADMEPLSFQEALEAEEKRIEENWGFTWRYKDFGYYYEQLRRYYDLFDSSQIKIYIYDEWKRDNVGTLRDLFGFLGVDSTFAPDTSLDANYGGVPKVNKINYLLMVENHPLKSVLKALLPKSFREKIRDFVRKRNRYKPEMSAEVRAKLQDTFREDVLKLQDLIGRDLSAWLE